MGARVTRAVEWIADMARYDAWRSDIAVTLQDEITK